MPEESNPKPHVTAATTGKTNNSRFQFALRRRHVQALILILVVGAGLLGRSLILSNRRHRATAPIVATANIDITDSGFVPQVIRIAKDSKVVWTNKDGADHQVAADPYPRDDNYPALGKGNVVAPQGTTTITYTKKGTFTYHDEKNPLKFNGTVIVE